LRRLNTLTNYDSLLDNFKDSEISSEILAKIKSHKQNITLMEVCGTHTVALFKTGIRYSLPENINLVSGPGCPVCVTCADTVEKAIGLAKRKDIVLFCFGDMFKVPGIEDNLDSARAKWGANVKLMYSPMDAFGFAKSNPDKKIVMFGVGFETTTPLFASVILRAEEENLKNLYLLAEFKLVPPALRALLDSKEIKLDGFILPGHVSAIIGEKAYSFIADEYSVPGVIAGFEPVDILEGIYCLTDMVSNKKSGVKNQYKRVVTFQGNLKAQEITDCVFTPCDSKWRGIGVLKDSGLRIKDELNRFDAQNLIDFDIISVPDPKGCLCANVIKGISKPTQCALFKTVCNPNNPVGPCMVSSEGSCAAYYKYGR